MPWRAAVKRAMPAVFGREDFGEDAMGREVAAGDDVVSKAGNEVRSVEDVLNVCVNQPERRVPTSEKRPPCERCEEGW